VPIGTDPRAASGFFGQFTDPLSPTEWWPSTSGAQLDRARPGVPLTMIDSGVDLSHQEFAGRPNTIALNTPDLRARTRTRLHGTATASVAARQSNGKGSSASTRRRSSSSGTRARPASSPSATRSRASPRQRRARGVINLSLGGFDRLPVEEHAILNAFAAGCSSSLGRERPEEGSSPSYPRASRTCSPSARPTRATA
jgi:subtilisin family serine protease